MSCWRLAACALACAHSSRSVAAIDASDAFHAARRCSSRDASSVCKPACDSRIVFSSDAECCSNVDVCAPISLADCASASMIACWRLVWSALVCAHSSPSFAAIAASDAFHAARRCSSRDASSVCKPACDSRIVFSNDAECCSNVDVCAPISRAVCASASLIACWRLVWLALVCARSSRSAAAIAASESRHAARRCSSRDASSVCSPACDARIVSSSDAECCPNAAAAVSSARALWPAIVSPACACCASVSRHASDIRCSVASRRVATPSSRSVERCAKVSVNWPSVVRRCSVDASFERCWSASARFQMPATLWVVASKPLDRPSSCRSTACVTVSRSTVISRVSPAIVAAITGCSAAPATRALSAALSCSDCPTDDASRPYACSVRSKKACWLAACCSCSATLRCSSVVIIVCSRSTSAGITSACRCSSRNDSSRRCACECTRSVVAIFASSCCAASMRSRRSSADSSPSIADVATPAIDVPNAKPRPLTGAISDARIASRSVALSSAAPVPLSVTTIPSSVPSIPSSTSRPTR